ncbi:ECF-type sigma factor [Rhodopirellula sallentina]|uniref:RNA polymerase sigma-70 ECF-like protein n=1 Tax=Rhodopirellula sallentina SM41 TaxID=1263870 RepID=M5U7U6_9BACT|nr:ECF-type sigma factor [Rhodopirellula sallentina]EMI57537.1 RNA polymerase sigma-70 ECF-like protein [Rhodopirellula sallentina SM41]
MEQFDQSVTHWIDGVRSGRDDAAASLWGRYFRRLESLARRKFGSASRRVVDEEDIVLSVFDSLCSGVREGRFTQLRDRDDLWRLLIVLTARKAVDQVRRQTSLKRGGGLVRGASVFAGGDDNMPQSIEEFVAGEPTAEFVALLEEQFAGRLEQLTEPVQRQIATKKLEGESNEAIAQQLGVSIRTVERKLNLIRLTWSAEQRLE